MTQPVDHFRGPPQTSRPKSLQWAIENQWLRAFFVSYWRSRSQRSPKVVSIPPIAQALNRRPFGSSAASQPRGRKAPLFAVEISSTLGNSVQGASIPDLPTGADLWGSDTPRDGVWSVSYFTFENFFDRLSRPRHHGCKDGKYVDADHRCPERVISGCVGRSAARQVNLDKRTPTPRHPPAG